jgi:CSLREA domain-containing protein
LKAVAAPLIASAAEYTVDSTEDEKDALVGTAGCLTAGLKCTLRAAIEESNFSTGTKDTITFSGAVFEGKAADTLAPVTALPTITDPVNVLGGDCFGEDGPDAPCAGIKGPSGAAGLTVEDANGVVIEGLAITGAQFGIDVVSGSEGFVARNDWIGLNLSAADRQQLRRSGERKRDPRRRPRQRSARQHGAGKRRGRDQDQEPSGHRYDREPDRREHR